MKIPQSSLTAVLSLIALCLYSGTGAAQGHEKPSNQTSDEAAIRENVKQMQEGWNSKNSKHYAALFAEDADYVVANGMYDSGRSNIEKGHEQIFTGIYKDATIDLSVKRIRFLRADVAIVHVISQFKRKTAERTIESEGLIILVMTKEGSGWKIASFQNTKIENPQRK